MSHVYFISDLHLGHKRILEFVGHLRDGTCVDSHDATLVAKWNSVVTRRDVVYVVGDVVFEEDRLPLLRALNGRKILVRGNHDDRIPTSTWLDYFEEVHGVVRYKNHWVSHAPIHPAELRGKDNIHGHVHESSIKDSEGEYDRRYINVCVEALDGYPINYQRILDGAYWKIKKA